MKLFQFLFVFLIFLGVQIFVVPNLWASSSPATKPKRIISTNVCNDQLLLMLVDKKRIASLSYLAARPDDSLMADKAQGLPLNHGLAEEILALKPDLILSGSYGPRFALHLMQSLNIPVLTLSPARSLAEMRHNIRAIAKATGDMEKAEKIIAKMDREIAQINKMEEKNNSLAQKQPGALIFRSGGFSAGEIGRAHV